MIYTKKGGKQMSLSFETSADNDSEIQELLDFEEPKRYNVILLNDDYTTKDFVVLILVKIFQKSEGEAIMLTEKIHKSGSAIVGVYTFDIAETLKEQVIQTARLNGFPLKCILEQA